MRDRASVINELARIGLTSVYEQVSAKRISKASEYLTAALEDPSEMLAYIVLRVAAGQPQWQNVEKATDAIRASRPPEGYAGRSVWGCFRA